MASKKTNKKASKKTSKKAASNGTTTTTTRTRATAEERDALIGAFTLAARHAAVLKPADVIAAELSELPETVRANAVKRSCEVPGSDTFDADAFKVAALAALDSVPHVVARPGRKAQTWSEGEARTFHAYHAPAKKGANGDDKPGRVSVTIPMADHLRDADEIRVTPTASGFTVEVVSRK